MQKLPDYLTDDEVKSILNAATKNHKHWLILKVLYETALRNSELCNMRIENLIPPSSEILPQIHITGKGKKDRFVPLSMQLYNLMKMYNRTRKKGYFFLNKQNKKYTTTGIRLIVYKYAKIAKIDRILVHPHTFRHTRAIYLLRHGMSLNELKEFLGHSALETTAIYLKILPKEMLDRYKSIIENEYNY